MEILEHLPPPPGPSEALSSPWSRKRAAICEAKQKHNDREAGVPVAQPQHSPVFLIAMRLLAQVKKPCVRERDD
ncbi:hypothetical protein FRC02_011911 [Tulasnella sp. 418]|nr:hypothetical protein FRC02_011911 [Tulasnella sp. 418]